MFANLITMTLTSNNSLISLGHDLTVNIGLCEAIEIINGYSKDYFDNKSLSEIRVRILFKLKYRT